MRDPYSVLGVRRNADQEEIKAAWRSLAKSVHPDQNRDDPFATIRFTEAGRAYDLLRDPEKRSRYDSAHREARLRRMEQMRRREAERKTGGETEKPFDETAEEMIARIFGVDARQQQTEAKPQAARPQAANAQPRAAESRPEPKDETADEESETGRSPAPAADIISAIVRTIRGMRARTADKAPDLVCDAVVTVEDILNRTRVSVEIEDGQSLKVQLGPGMTEGHVIRLREQGHRIEKMKRGDAVVTLRIAPGRFRVDGFELHTELPLTIENAVLGCETTVEGPLGTLPLTVPAWTGSDKSIRIEGEGLADSSGKRADLVVAVRLLLWEKPDEKMIDLMRSLKEGLYL
ncbi:MAG: DnaJ domain-containing protein [Shinella sp.]|nr:DnaJ domain-containing protein [Shinella sp.]